MVLDLLAQTLQCISWECVPGAVAFLASKHMNFSYFSEHLC